MSAGSCHITAREARGRAASGVPVDHGLAGAGRRRGPRRRRSVPGGGVDAPLERCPRRRRPPGAPTAESIHQRLNRRRGLKLSWRRIVDAALAEGDTQTQTAAAWRTEKNKDLDLRNVGYALALVARELDGQPFPPEDYERACEALIARERRRLGDDSPLDELLPTVSQVERIAGSWDDALALVGLQPYAQRPQRAIRRRNSMPVIEAVALFVELNERFPSYPMLSRWPARPPSACPCRPGRRAAGGRPCSMTSPRC